MQGAMTAEAIVQLAERSADTVFTGGWNKMAGSVAVQPDGRVDWSPAFYGGVSTEATAVLYAHLPPGHPGLQSKRALVRALMASAAVTRREAKGGLRGWRAWIADRDGPWAENRAVAIDAILDVPLAEEAADDECQPFCGCSRHDHEEDAALGKEAVS
jgi:hypothetical protein